jgi:uncharacterized membrane protein YkvA (DUF1232 family)
MKDIVNFLKENAVLILSLIYILSPIDFIPDFLAPLGLIDDLGAVLVMLGNAGYRYLKKKSELTEERITGREKTVNIGRVKSKDVD